MAEAKKSIKKSAKKAELIVETAVETANVPLDLETTRVPETKGTDEQVAEDKSHTSVDTAKAGKRSAKAIAEAEERQAKEDRKASGEVAEGKPKQTAKPTRSKLERRSKGFRKAAELLEKGKTYTVDEAVVLAKKTSPVKFDATVELHVRLGVDPRQADQNIRDNLVLPAGTGRTVRIAVFDDETVAGADLVGIEAITKQLDKGEMNFDVLISTPAQMAKLGKYARLLGPRGLMPNPKSGTVTTDVAKAVNEAKAGRVEYRVDSTGIIHLGIGKVSFSPEQLSSNVGAVIASLKSNKPASIKGVYFKSIHLSTTMGPSIAVDLASTN